jgi:uroporphyrinogen-III synthase
MSLRVAITRAAPEADLTAERVRERGAIPILTPLLTIEPRAFNADVSGAQALLFTSANGVRAFAKASPSRNPVVLTVGDATAAAARDAGFADVRSADGDGIALAALAQQALDPARGALLHISGAHIAIDIAAALTAAGFHAERRIAYEAVAAASLPQAFAPPLDIVLFHSARAAEIFHRLGAPNADKITAVCLSPAVAAAATFSPWKQVVVAAKPREDALLESAFAQPGASA